MALLGTFQYDNLIAGDKAIDTIDITIPQGTTIVRGTVLGRVKTNVPTTGTADGGNTGDGTCTAVTGGENTQIGTYTVECVLAVTNGGHFRLKDPSGAFVGDVIITAGAGGTGVLKTSELNLTITDGATDFALADKFTIAVASGVPSTGTADGGNTGNGTMTAVEGRRYTKIGAYTITCTAAATNSGTFSVVDPDGKTLAGSAVVGTAYDVDQIKFLINDGSTDFIVGDIFTITVTYGLRVCKAVDSSQTDGTQTAYGIAAEDIDASSGGTNANTKSVAYLSGQFNERSLIYGGTDTNEDHQDALRALGIFLDPSTPAGDIETSA